MASNCPTKVELEELLKGTLPPGNSAALDQHLLECAACRQQLNALAGGNESWLKGRTPPVDSLDSPPLRDRMNQLKRGQRAASDDSSGTLARQITRLRYLGDYEILDELGRGGMGVVYRARQVSLQREVAVKVILAGQLASAAHVRRFHVEAEAAAKLDHPNIVPIFEIGEHEGHHFFSMKLVQGQTLAERLSGSADLQSAVSPTCSRQGVESAETIKKGQGSAGCKPAIRQIENLRYEEREAARLLATIARAVHYAHQRGVLHRDLKPGNILIDREGRPHVTDFGLAKLIEHDSSLTHSMAVMGSPNYMAPEQAAGHSREATTAVDVFSLGAILYELLTGCPPFQADSSAKTIRLVLETDPVSPVVHNPCVPPDLATICLKCLEKEPARRYASAELLAEDLDRFCRGEPILARPVNWAERSWRWSRRNPALAGALVALVLVFFVGFSGVVWKWNGEIQQRKLAQQESQRAQKAVTRLEIERAESLLQSGDSTKGLAYLSRLLRQQPTNQVVAERLMSALTYRSFSLPVAPLRHGKALNSLTGKRKESFEKTRFAFVYPGSLVTANFSPDGWRVVTASQDGTARLWNAINGEPLGEPMRHDAEVLGAQVSQDGQRIITASVDGSARIWRADTSQLAAPPLRHADLVHWAAFSPNGHRAVTASRDKTAQIWNVHTGQPVGAALLHPEPVIFACFSPDGSRLLTADESECARLWDQETGATLATADHFYFPACPEPFPQFSPSGEQVVSLRRYHAYLRDPRSNLVAFARLEHDSFLIGATYSPDGRHIATVSVDSTARIWDAATGQASVAALRHDSEVLLAQFSPDGRRLLTSSLDKSARLWDVATGHPLTEPLRQERAVLSAKIGACGQRVATVSETDTAWLWDVRLLQPLVVLRWLPIGVKFGRFSPDGRQVVVVDEANTARVWNAQSGVAETKAMTHAQPDRCVISDAEFSPDGRCVATASETLTTNAYAGEARIWDASTGELIGRPLPHRAVPRRVRFSPDGRRLATASMDGTARVWDVDSGNQQLELQHGGLVECVAFSPDGKWVATASWDTTAQLWDAITGHPRGKPLKHDAEVFWIVFDRAGQRVATASKDKTVRIWSAQNGQMLTQPLVHADALHLRHSVTFSLDGLRLATAAGNSAQVWDALSGRAITTPLRHGGLVQTVQFSPDGRKLLSASDDGTARLWDPETGHPVSEPLRHGGRVTSAGFSPDGSRVLTCSSDKSIRIWEITSAPLPVPPWLPSLAEAIAGQRIDDKDVSEVVPVEELYRFRQRLALNAPQSYYDRWARWFFAESANRPISPSSDVTSLDYVKRRIGENTLESLQEATRLSPTNALAFARLAQSLIATNQTVRAGASADAEWFSRYATSQAANDLEVRRIRQSVLEEISRLTNNPAAPIVR